MTAADLIIMLCRTDRHLLIQVVDRSHQTLGNQAGQNIPADHEQVGKVVGGSCCLDLHVLVALIRRQSGQLEIDVELVLDDLKAYPIGRRRSSFGDSSTIPQFNGGRTAGLCLISGALAEQGQADEGQQRNECDANSTRSLHNKSSL
ncbi:hypothetical protein SDC9_69703 [bioreactor metagenome]|uniref:Uncharacterized protein n=1 Tax=bioreactor metagenome TaxID=1076179 RepID=A0A644Y5L4_9ZZZZ